MLGNRRSCGARRVVVLRSEHRLGRDLEVPVLPIDGDDDAVSRGLVSRVD